MARLQPNRAKIVEAILLLIEEAGRHRRTLTQYDVVKSLFIADLWHLKKFGRPITFDNYVAMKFGPVPSEAYDMLKPIYAWRGTPQPEGWPLWDRKATEGSNVAHFENPRRSANRRKLSDTDVRELTEALSFVMNLGFGGVCDWTHMNPAYVDAWKARGDRKSNEMRYELLLEGKDKELISELAHASKHM
ncbi:MAG: Panacea domain-containing protein [Rhizomicrobium sp.]|nr:Panacea domain-containing protein [Rhizomicrobium sp.]